MSSLVFKENKDNYVPFGFDHVGLSVNSNVYESHPGYSSGRTKDESGNAVNNEYYDIENGNWVSIENIFGVQKVNTLGTFKHESGSIVNTPIAKFTQVTISDSLAQLMAEQIETKMRAGFLNIVPNQHIATWDDPSNLLKQKGGNGKFTCVGLMEWAAEQAGHNRGNGFIPNFAEWINLFNGRALPILLTPELLYRYASNTTVTDIIKKQAEEFAVGCKLCCSGDKKLF